MKPLETRESTSLGVGAPEDGVPFEENSELCRRSSEALCDSDMSRQMDTNGKWQIVCSPQKRWSPLNTGHSSLSTRMHHCITQIRALRECVLFIGTEFSILYNSVYPPAGAACGLTPCVVRGSTGRECLRLSLRFLLLMPPRGEDSLELEVRPKGIIRPKSSGFRVHPVRV